MEKIQKTDDQENFLALFDNVPCGVVIYEETPDKQDFTIKDFNVSALIIDKVKKEDVVGKKITEAFPGIKKFGLLKVLEEVNRTGRPQTHPLSFYKDDRISGWRENFVIKLPSGEVAAIYLDASDKKKSDEKLKESEDNFRLIAENTGDLITVADLSPDPKYEYVSPSSLSILGYHPEELKGKSVFLNVEPEDKKALLPILSNELAKAAIGARNETIKISYRIRHKNGTYRILETTANRYGRQLIFVSRDITDIKSFEEKITEAAEEWRATFDSLPEGISIHDKNFNILRTNRTLCTILGKSLDEILNHKCYQLFHQQNIPIKECPLSKAMKSGRKESLEYFEPSLNRWLLAICSPIVDKDGKVRNFVQAVTDITDRKKTEKDLIYRMGQMEKINKLTIGRELKMVELKKKLRAIEKNTYHGD